MRELVRLSLRGRWGQVVALAVTMAFSATLVGALGVLTETGVRGQVSTGEYAAAPLLVAARQTRPVADDVDLSVPGRALLPESVVDAIADAAPGAEVVADVVVPAVVDRADDDPLPLEVHPWSALTLGVRDLASGRAPERADEVVVPARLDGAGPVAPGDEVEVGFGDEAVALTVVGTTTADDDGTDVPDAYVSDVEATLGTGGDRVAAVGVWPQDGADDAEVADAVAKVAAAHGATLWPASDRGEVEVVRQGPAKGALVSAAAAFGALAIIVSVFTLVALSSLQIRERSRELSLLRVVGATPRQVKRLLRGEMRRVAVVAASVGAVAGGVLGGRLVDLLRSWDVVPRSLEPVHSVLPLVAALGVVLGSTEVAARVSSRRVVRSSPLAGLEGADERSATGARGRLRTTAGVAGVALGLAMACAPAYATGEAALGLPGLSGLVIAVSLGPLSPAVVRLAARTQWRLAAGSAPRYLALASLRARSARVGGALSPIVLGVSLSATQLFSGSTMAAIADDQVESGQHADLLVTAPVTGVDDTVADDVAALSGVAAVDPVVRADVLVLGRQDEPYWVPLPALAVGGDRVERYADLRPIGADSLSPDAGQVALSAQAAAALGAEQGDELTLALPDGREVERTVGTRFVRGLGFGDVVLPVADLQPATASGRPTALAVTVADDASVPDVEARVEEGLAGRPGLEVDGAASAGPSDAAAADVAFPVLLLLILWGYIAIAVVSSLVVTTLARRGELATLRVVGATPSQRRRTARWEAAFLAATGCVVASLASLPGLCGLTFALSHGERLLPGIDLLTYVVVVAVSFALVTVATELPTRKAMRARS